MNRTEYFNHRLAEVNEGIELAENITKLTKNSLFKKVILQGYFKDEAVRLVSLLSDANQQSPEVQALINNAMRGIGELQSWLNANIQMGIQLRKEKRDIEQELEVLANEPDEEDVEGSEAE
ncbi:MAG: hypothetical protein CMC55_06075 [Flavobacteriaceae bacterium]|nr:hypothetical protein [Flavobacteriaceae bacterium]